MGARTRIGLLLAAAMLAVVLPAAAIDLDGAKAQGLVGERPDGYVEAVGDASAEVRTFVQDVNAKRRVAYEKVAGQNGAPVDDVAKIAGKKLIDNARPGTFVKVDGRWVKKS